MLQPKVRNNINFTQDPANGKAFFIAYPAFDSLSAFLHHHIVQEKIRKQLT